MKASCPYPPSCREHPFPETGPLEPTDRTEVDSEAPALLAKMQKTRRRVLEIPTRHRVSISQPGARSQMCRPCRSPPEGNPKTYSTPLLPTTQDGVPKHAPADKQGDGRQDHRPGRYATARGQVLLHRRFHSHGLLLGDGGRHKDQHGHQCGYGQIKYPFHESLPPSLYSLSGARSGRVLRSTCTNYSSSWYSNAILR